MSEEKNLVICDVITKKKETSRRVDTKLIMKAFNFANEKHKNQKRVSGEPYIIHPINVAYILAEIGLDDSTICAALLHDIVEDTDTTHEDLVQNFGTEIADMVQGVTKLGNIQFATIEETQVENKKESQEANSEISQENKEENQLVEKECVDDKPVVNKNKLTLKELVENDLEITEADVRELKSETNRFKVAMLLQAKSRLSMVLKLCDVLDKLYAELVDRIDLSLKTTDTPSLMFTADYVSKALSDTNQFIMSLITNEKIQNFFIIDNSNVINITENRVDIDKREKIRKAAEIVIENVDYFSEGQYDKLVNPNAVEVEKGVDTDANLSAKSVSSE